MLVETDNHYYLIVSEIKISLYRKVMLQENRILIYEPVMKGNKMHMHSF